MARHSSKTTTDHEEIRRWAEERGGRPARVKGTGGNGDTGMIRLDFPGYSGAEKLEEISWDEWFRSFDEYNLALVYQETTAAGKKSNFNKLIGRETARERAKGKTKYSRRYGTQGKQGAAKKKTGTAARSKAARGGAGGARKSAAKSRRKAAGKSGRTTAKKAGVRKGL